MPNVFKTKYLFFKCINEQLKRRQFVLNLVKIREKSHIILWTLLFFFLLSMIVGGLVGGANIMDIIFGGGNQGGLYVGVVGETKITRQEFLQERSNQLNRLRQQNQTLDGRTVMNAENTAWNSIVDRTIISQKIESLGLESSDEEIYDFLLYSPPASLQNQLTDSGFFTNEDGLFDLDAYQNALQTGTYEVSEDFWRAWDNYLKSFLPGRKLQSLYNMAGGISDSEVEKEYIKRNLNCTLEYLYVNSNNIVDSLIEVTNEEILERYNQQKDERFAIDKSKVAEYVYWENPEALPEDSLDTVALQDSIYQIALLFSEDAKISSFSKIVFSNALNIADTINVTESYSNNSGIPNDLGLLRTAVRFCFDNPIGSVSDPITTTNGFAVFHILGNEDAGYRDIEDVREGLKSQLIRDNKKVYARSILEGLTINGDTDLETIANENELIEFQSGEEKNIGGSFTGIGKSSSLTGTLLAMEPGNISGVLETFNSAVIIRMVDKDELIPEEFEEAKAELKEQLLNSRQINGYNNWLTEMKKTIKIEDYRSSIF